MLVSAMLASMSAARSLQEADLVLGSDATISSSDVPSAPVIAAADTAPCATSADESAAKSSRTETSMDSRGPGIYRCLLSPSSVRVAAHLNSGRCGSTATCLADGGCTRACLSVETLVCA